MDAQTQDTMLIFAYTLFLIDDFKQYKQEHKSYIFCV